MLKDFALFLAVMLEALSTHDETLANHMYCALKTVLFKALYSWVLLSSAESFKGSLPKKCCI